MECPRCHVRLQRLTARTGGVYYQCPECRGRAAALAVLRQTRAKPFVRSLWAAARDRQCPPSSDCPVCHRAMAEVSMPVGPAMPSLQLDVCLRCQFAWFDAHEYEQIPSVHELPEPPLSAEARKAIALRELQLAEQKANATREGAPPSDPWQLIPAIFGMPVEEHAPPVRCWPWLTYGLAAILVLVFALTCRDLHAVIYEYGFVPSRLFRYHGLTFVASFFLHAGVMHLIGNVYFLLIFGDNVEDDLGWWKCLLLIAVAAFIGDLWHVLSTPQSPIPCVGASGGISGVITYYALRYPHARLGYFLGSWRYHRYVRFPAWVALVFWLLIQGLFVVQQKWGIGGVAAWAHLGGAAVGLVAWLLGQIGGQVEGEAV